jgi:serine/threonine-protein kinase
MNSRFEGDYGRLYELAEQALAVAPGERDAWLRQACGNEPELIAQVRRLIDLTDDEQAVTLDTFARDVARNDIVDRRIGSCIGEYEIVGVLGSGGSSTVYRAVKADWGDSHPVALKILDVGLHDPEMSRRFMLEQRILRRARHPSICQLLDVGVTERGEPYIVMEHVDGCTIDQYVQRKKLLLDARLELFERICDAVHHAHVSLIIHCDIKPANILVCNNGNPKLLDFGVSKIVDESQDPGVTATVHRWMTINYASPEQLAGAGATVLSDIYSLGVLLFRLLTGRQPYDLRGKGMLEIWEIASGARLPRAGASLHLPGKDEYVMPLPVTRVPADVDTILRKTLDPRPGERYQSALELAADVRRFLANEPIVARPPTLWYVVRKFIQRNAVSSTLLLLLFASTLAFSAFSIWQTYRVLEESRQVAWHEQINREVRDYLIDIFARSTPYAGEADKTARELLDEASAQINRKFPTDSALKVELLRMLGEAYYEQGEDGKASEFLREALLVHHRVPDSKPANEYLIRATLGYLQSLGGDLDAAAQQTADLHARLRADFVRDDLAYARFRLNLAHLDIELGEFARAEVGYREVKTVLEETDRMRTLDYLHALDGLSEVYYFQGDARESEYVMQAYHLASEVFGEEHPRTAPYLMAIASGKAANKQYNDAIRLMRKVVAIYARALPDTHPERLWIAANNVRLMVAAGRHEEAAEGMRALLTRNYRNHLSPWQNAAVTLTHATLELRREQFQAAEDMLLGLIGEDAGGEFADEVRQQALHRLVELYTAQGRSDEAAEYAAAADPAFEPEW